MDAVIYLRVSTKEQASNDEAGEGYSIPAQREACLRQIAERGWSLAGEFTDAGESARTADRPMLKALLRRVAEGGIGAVVVHKIDRLARSMEDHVAIRATLRHAGVQLVSVTENIEETASGRLVEGIHALMAEFYSANLAGEIRKGMTQKAKINDVFREEAASERYRDVLGVFQDPLVSSDIIGDSRASVVDLNMTRVVDGTLVKIMSWYDNEWGFTHQMVRQAKEMLGVHASV